MVSVLQVTVQCCAFYQTVNHISEKMKLSTVPNDILPLSTTTLRSIHQDSYLLVDTRPVSKYNSSHIRHAVNMNCSPLLLRRILRGTGSADKLLFSEETKKRLQRGMCQFIILYDDESSDFNEGTLGKDIKIITAALQKGKKNKSFFYLNGGFKDMSREHPSWCESSSSSPVDSQALRLNVHYSSDADMNDPTDHMYGPLEHEPVLILPFLYLGSVYHASNKDVLEQLGITAIVNVSKSCQNMFEDKFAYKTVPVDDSFSEDIGRHFAETFSFIDDVKSKNGKVLVHCKAGVSRSATMCIAYLMTRQRLTLDEAYEFIKKRRSRISPNFNFLGQLLTLESTVLAEKENALKSTATAGSPLSNATKSLTPLASSDNMFVYPPRPSTPCSFQTGNSFFKSNTRSPLFLQTP